MQTELDKYLKIIDNFPQARIGVIGDMVADIYIYGKPSRISREAPILIIDYESEEIIPGSAANTVRNLAALGVDVYPVGILGSDAIGSELDSIFNEMNIDTRGLVFAKNWTTTSKTRLLAGDSDTIKQQMVRIDRKNNPKTLPQDIEDEILENVNLINNEVEAWIISDYGYELLTDTIRKRLLNIAANKIIIADSRYNLNLFAGITAIIPNESEARKAVDVNVDKDGDITDIGTSLLSTLDIEALLITRGNKGMALFHDNDIVEHIPISGTPDIVDVTGAGDTVTSVFTLSLVSGATFSQAARLANVGAGIVVMKRGAATVSVKEIIEVLNSEFE